MWFWLRKSRGIGSLNIRFLFLLCLAPFVLSACQTSQVATSSFAGNNLNGAPVRSAVKPSHKVVNERDKKASAKRKAKASSKSARKGKRGRLTVSEGRRRYGKIIAKHARANGVPVRLAMAVVQVESTFRANARGAAGEVGLMQLLPTTARFIGYKGPMKKLYNPDTNIRYGMKYLGKAHKLGGGSTCGTILKYNAGHGAKRMNKISRRYCQRIKRILRKG